MIRALLIDDEPLARALLHEYLATIPDIEIIGECEDGFEGVKAIAKLKPDLIFLDVQMPKINGFEMLELLDHPPHVIFITAFDNYAMRAFETNAIDYVQKPVSKQRLEKAVQRVKAKISANAETTSLPMVQALAESNRIVVKYNGNIKIIPAEEIFYIEAFDDYVKIFTEKDCFLKKKTMSELEKQLNESEFMRCHRSFIIQLKKVTRVEPYEKLKYLALLANGKKIPISRSGYARLKEILGI